MITYYLKKPASVVHESQVKFASREVEVRADVTGKVDERLG